MNSPIKEYLELKKISNTCYFVSCLGNKKVLGEFYQEVDGFFVFEPKWTAGDGFWEWWILQEIVDKLRVINKPWEDIINNYPAFRKDNSSKNEGWDG